MLKGVIRNFRTGDFVQCGEHLGRVSEQSLLNGAVMDALHGDGIEIVSPFFRNVRSLPDDRRFMSKTRAAARSEKARLSKSEELAFDKADAAESLDEMREQMKKIDEKTALLAEQLKQAKELAERESLEGARSRLESRKQALSALIVEREEERKAEG
jgi:hypothetical protein